MGLFKRNLGGERVGTGNKMNVEMNVYERSTHDLGYVFRTTMSAGTLVPFMSELGLPGDTWDINLNADVLTHPTLGPLFGSMKVQLDVYEVPMRLYIPSLQNNFLNAGLDMSQFKFPQITVTAPNMVNDEENQINPSSILHYLGISGVGRSTDYTNENAKIQRNFNAIPYISMFDIYKNYYANKQEEEGVIIHKATQPSGTYGTVKWYPHNPPVPGTSYDWILIQHFPSLPDIPATVTPGDTLVISLISGVFNPEEIMLITDSGIYAMTELFAEGAFDPGTGDYTTGEALVAITIKQWAVDGEAGTPVDRPRLRRFDLNEIDQLRTYLVVQGTQPGTQVVLDGNGDNCWNWPLTYTIEPGKTPKTAAQQTQEGLLIKTYQSDVFNVWLKTEWITAINSQTAVQTVGGQFTIDQLAFSKKMWTLLNRVAASGGSYYDWIETVYTAQPLRQVQTPMYMGGLSKELIFQEVVSNSTSQTSEGLQPLGQLAGRGVLGKKHKGGNVYIKVQEPSYIIGIVSITPRLDYSQGNKWDMDLQHMNQLHMPELDEIGFQDLITDRMFYIDSEIVPDANPTATRPTFKSAGKQPAWIDYTTNVNRTHGNFAIKTNEMFMTLNRRYEKDINGIRDLTTYVDPSKFNYIFAETRLDAMNYWVQIAIDATVRRKMSARMMPAL